MNILKPQLLLSSLKFFLLSGFFIYLIALFSYKEIKADNFMPSNDIANCHLATTNTVSYESLPSRHEVVGGFTYDQSLVSGASGSSFVTSTRFTPDLGNMTYPNAHRFRGVAEAISVPPNTKVDVGIYFYNYTGHNVHVPDVQLFTSQSDPNLGDWTRLGAQGSYGSINWNDHNSNIVRNGKYYNIPINRNVLTSEGSSPFGQKIYSFTTIQPIQSRSRDIQYSFNSNGELILRILNNVENVSSYQLNNINFQTSVNGVNLITSDNFNPYTRKDVVTEYNFGLNYPKNIFIPATTIHDPNSHTEVTTTPNQASMVIRRNDLGYPNTYANQIDYRHDGVRMSVTLIPYTIYSQANSLVLNEDLSIDKRVSDIDEIMVKENTIFGIEEFNYTIELNNSGARADNVVINDVYDKSFLEILEVSHGGVVDSENGRIRWVFPNVHNKQKIELKIKVKISKVLPAGKYTFKNIALIEHTNKTSEVNTVVDFIVENKISKQVRPNSNIRKFSSDKQLYPPQNDLFVKSYSNQSLIDSNLFFAMGDTIEYRLLFGNTGNGISVNTFLIDSLPFKIKTLNNQGSPDLDILSSAIEIIEWKGISEDAAMDYSLNIVEGEVVISWYFDELLPDENLKSITYQVRVLNQEEIDLSLVDDDRNINNVVSLVSDNYASISDSALIQIVDPIITLVKNGSYEVRGKERFISYRIVITNTGSGIFIGELRDALPKSLSFVETKNTDLEYVINEDNEIIFRNLFLNPSEILEIEIETSVLETLDLCNEQEIKNEASLISATNPDHKYTAETTTIIKPEDCAVPITTNYTLSDTGGSSVNSLNSLINLFSIISSSLSAYFVLKTGGFF